METKKTTFSDVKGVYVNLKKNAEDFYEEHKIHLDVLENKIYRNIVDIARLGTDDFEKNRANFDCLKLIDLAVRSSHSCFYLVKLEKFRDASIIYQKIIEWCSTAIAINKDEQMYKKFLSQITFSVQDTFIISEKFIPEISMISDKLNSFYSHRNKKVYLKISSYENRQLEEIFNVAATCMESFASTEENYEIVFMHLDLIINLILYTKEIIFSDDIEKLDDIIHFYHDADKHYSVESGITSFKKIYNALYKK